MKISIYIPVFNQRDALARTLRALIPEKEGHEVIVVDRGSSDGSKDVVSEYPWATAVTQTLPTLGACLNEAVSSVGDGEGLLFLQPGSLPERGWSASLSNHLTSTDAGHLRVQEIDAPSAWSATVRSVAQRFGHTLLGGPAGLNGVVVKRETFATQNGFSPLPDFEWLAFASRLKENGASVKPLKHTVLITPEPGADFADAWTDLKEDFLAAWRFRKTSKLDETRLRRQASAAIVLAPDIFPDDEKSEYISYARDTLLKLNLGLLQSFRGVDKVYVMGKEHSMKLLGQPSGVEIVPGPRTALQKRFLSVLDSLRSPESEGGVLLVRAISTEVSHASLKALLEGPSETPCRILPEADSGEWAALWLEGDALKQIDGWELSSDFASLQEYFRPLTIRQDVEAPVRCLRSDSDARALFYLGHLDRLPA